MRFIVFADLHAHNYREFDVSGSRLKNCMKVVADVFEYAHKEGITDVLFVGDWYDQQKAIPTSVINTSIKTLKMLFELYPDIVMYSISGNHDYASKNLIDAPAITALEHLETIFQDRFILLDNRKAYFPDAELNIYGIPYYEYPEHFQTKLEELDKKIKMADMMKFNILMIHQTPAEIDNPYIPFDTDPNNTLYRNFDLVLCGHIHKKKVITSQFMVVGSPLHRDAGDEGDIKGMWIINSDNFADKTFIELEYPKIITVPEDAESNGTTDYLVRVPVVDDTEATQARVEEFRSDLGNEELVTNYWNEVDGKDKALLEAGLSFVRNVTPGT